LSVQFSFIAKFRPRSILKIQRKKIKLVYTHVKWSYFKYEKGLEKEVQGDSFKIALYNFVQTDFGSTMSPNTLYMMPSTLKSHKNPIKDQWPKPSQAGETKREGQKTHSLQEPKKGEG
jgi:hypothetical protein